MILFTQSVFSQNRKYLYGGIEAEILKEPEPLNLVIKYARRKENLALTISNQLELDSAELISLMNDSSTLSTAKMDSNNIIKININ